MPDPPRNGEWDDLSFCECKPYNWSLLPEKYKTPEHCLYRSTWDGDKLVGWIPSIHMFRWASRITLEVVSVRVERLQEISEEDAKAEGVGHGFQLNGGWPDYQHIKGGVCELTQDTARMSFATLWDSINGKKHPWESNPWVWVVEFRKE